MRVRHGFSAVPRWRSRGVLGVAISAALIAELFVATSAAYAAPEAPTQQEPARGADGVLQAPDIATARTIARLEGERVEVIGERTVTSTTWVLPDGTMTTGQASGPIWISEGGDGTNAADWAAVDLTLERGSDGRVRPKAHPADLVLAGEGVPAEEALVSMAGPAGETVVVEWSDSLPVPRLEGPRAVYAEVQPGVDLVVEATRTGYEQYFVLTERPQAGEEPDLSLTVVSEGLAAQAADDGGVAFTDAAGAVVGSSGTPLAWDAEVDSERLHPITEPWASEGEQAGTALPPMPDWAEDPAPRTAPPAAPVTPASLPDEHGTPGEDAGRTQSPESADAGGSPALPLPEAAVVTAPGEVELSLTPDPAFLADAETTYPVVVDPAANFLWGFDTWVQTGYGTDQSGSTELRLGTFDGGATVARSFVNFDFSTIRYQKILEAQLGLWAWHSGSCTQSAWEVWQTTLAGTGTRINAQPTWLGKGATSTDTRGYSAACDDGWIGADVTGMVQLFSDNGIGPVGIGLKAYNETDNAAWKKFNSADAGAYVPAVYVRWNTEPNAPTGLAVTGSRTEGSVWAGSASPELTAVAADPEGDTMTMSFEVWRNNRTDKVWTGTAAGVPNGAVGKATVPPGTLTEGMPYTFRVSASDGRLWSAPSAWAPDFIVDTTKPAAPAVSSADYPSDGTWHKAENQAGTFSLTLPGADSTLSAFEWALDKTPDTRLAATGSTTLAVTPTTNGRHVLQVRSIDKAGNASPVVSYVFYVGRAGLVSPLEGAQVVRRVRLAVEGEALFTHVRFAWRRGPDAATSQGIALSTLTRANGAALTDPWTALADLGDYATWDAGSTLGHVPGPVQVQAILATDGTGTGSYATPWVTVTVSPDAQNAATDTIGPGSVNLLTGDYQLSSTDVDEFGLSIGRTASSRDPKSGFEPQRELLPAAQQSFSSIAGINTFGVSLARATTRGHTGMDALDVNPTGETVDSFAYPGNAVSAEIGMTAGRTYRVSGWIYVPAATGLTPDFSRGLRIVGFSANPSGNYISTSTSQPTLTDAWQQVSMDFVIPAGHTNPFIRLYSGFSAPGKHVYFDDLSVREIWSPLGPQWSLGTADEAAGTAYTHISQPYPDVAALHLSAGGEVWFTGSGANWWPEPGAESLRLASTGSGTWRLTELDGTVSDFTRQPGSDDAQLVMTSPPVSAGQTRLVYENVNGRVRLTRMIAPVEPGVDPTATPGTACTATVPAVGCEVLQLIYATATTATASQFGDFVDQVSDIRLLSAPSATATTTDSVPAVHYSYDDKGRLREVWDPRISPALKTSYDYDADGRVVQLGPPGELPWRFQYGTGGSRATVGAGDLVDRSSGRLRNVSRASLVPGTVDQTGPDTTSTVVYAVPLTRAAGGPHDLDPGTISSWAQRYGPTDGTAIFGPEDVPSVTTATDTAPGRDGYKPATIHYLDASGREVNTATPAGPDAPAGGFIDTAEYDQYGNVVRSLDATNRLLALGQMPSAAADLAALGLTQADTATRTIALSTQNTYGLEGLDLLRSRGPLLRLAVGNDPTNVQLVHDLTTNAYDEGKPDGVAYHLLTTTTEALLVAGSAPEQLVDVALTQNRYNPIDGASLLGPTSGWKIGQPTEVVMDAGPGGTAITAKIRYDEHGRAVESRKAGSSASDAGTSRAAFYTAGPNGDRAECGNNPAYAGLPCVNYVAGAVTGHDTSRMATNLPVRTVTAYNRYGSVASVTESATGPVGGSTVTQSRTTTTVYDSADRITSVTISGTGTGTVAVALGRTVPTYDPVSGDVTRVESRDPVNDAVVVSATEKTFDRLGRMTRYEDGVGGVTTSVFDRYGKPTTVSDSLGTTTSFTYDRSVEPRGFVTSVTDSVGGTLSATYGPDGQLLTQSLPGGVKLSVAYDANRNPITRTYSRTSDDQVISSSAVLENASGQWIAHTTAASTKRYSYDRIGRLTDVADTTTGVGLCTARRYGFNDRAERTSMTTAVSGTSTCANPDNPGGAAVSTAGYTYDSADRLVSDSATGAGAWIYDPLGRITTAPVRGSPGAVVANAFYANDLVASQTIAGVARQSWTLDALQRFSSYTNEAWAVGGNGQPGWQQAVTKVNHYDSDSDSPAWIAEDSSLPNEVTRYVDGLDGNLAVQTGKSGARVLQLVDLHGDVMTTLPIADGQNIADWTTLRHQAADEYGNPTDLTTGTTRASTGQAPGRDGRYGWLGGKQRSADALAGVILMGVRLYDPGTGRFWSTDPTPGGNATAYDYCSADPVNCSDLDGRWGWLDKVVKTVKKAAKVIAPIAALASMIPGPIGAAAAGISAVAYAASGNKVKALEMGITAAAAMIPGGGAAARAGFAAARQAGSRFSANLAVRVASRIYKMPAGRGEAWAASLGTKGGGARNFVGSWLGRQVKNPRNDAYFGKGGTLNTGPGNRIGLSPKPGTGGKVQRPAIRIATPGKKASRQPHYYLD